MTSNVIAIDGPAYVGKSEIAKALSRLTGFAYINTGHMYRAVAKKALESRIDAEDEVSILDLLPDLKIEFRLAQGQWRTFVNGEDWTDLLNQQEIVLFASKIAVIPEVREILTERQRELAERQSIIMEGRDIGSVVFPDAKWKFFITASEDIRAKRMYKMASEEERGKIRDYKELIPKVNELDARDRNRKVAPLIEPNDAIIYDNTESPTAEDDARILKQCIDHPEMISKNRLINYSESVLSRG